LKNIAVDVGNTRIKWALFEDGNLSSVNRINSGLDDQFHWPDYDQMIISSVRNLSDSLKIPETKKPLWLSHETPVPIQLDYSTPETLGLDRIAAAVGAWSLFPDQNCLVIDLGTCITFDLVTSDGIFRGGAIAPGLHMRLQAMHEFTDKLPLVKTGETINDSFPAKSTKESLFVGAEMGVLHEIEGYISRLQKENDNLCVILTGGDASFFESKVKAPIFVRPELNLWGLNRILLYNEFKA
jgi:type III pantothenate kinase